MITQSDKQEIFEAARGQMLEWYGASLAEQGACLYWNQVAMRELHMRGYRPVLQAGDMLWRIVPDYRDYGQAATHFGYEWSPDDPFSVAQVAQGLLPEVHVWCALPDERCIVDFSTAYFQRIAKDRYGLDWRTLPAPEFVFGAPPPNAFYTPNLEATRYVWRFIMEKLADKSTAAAAIVERVKAGEEIEA